MFIQKNLTSHNIVILIHLELCMLLTVVILMFLEWIALSNLLTVVNLLFLAS